MLAYFTMDVVKCMNYDIHSQQVFEMQKNIDCHLSNDDDPEFVNISLFPGEKNELNYH